MKHFILIALFTFSIGFISCDEDGDFHVEGPVIIDAGAASAIVINRSNEEVYYFIVDQNTLAVLLWSPSVRDGQPSIEPGQQVTINYTNDVLGFTNQTQTIIFYYWVAVENDNERVPGKISEVSINL